ncbi:recombination mediator RecR [Faecalicoccus pleomorphus]|uniref:recombination mediator RecR n=1 Tax=Faecalicoccus pleomorphus TaxID=1323 RepID=UPI0019612829|nr:recombination mediator RecR [Faecalicoccus pleomorphus]MBM6678582.1 recombination protein RecR [Faecalicoccus pleomorphus]MDB7987419.1 recombination mediator RecR [Faecalicoccus pleomorphus]MDB7991610.1 recombination mediator RecR [Faecalicoccus pleomorphus]
MYPKKFENLILVFQNLPGVGRKTAERYAFETLNWEQQKKEEFVNALQVLIDGVDTCKVCGNLSDGDICSICSDQNRDHTLLCVVQSPKDILAIESIQEYKGVYHVLNGVINTSKGILPEDINIDSLVDRINKDEINEVILALDPTVEGETTSLYIEKLIGKDVLVTRLAYGIPMGGHLDYTDSLTLLKAFQGRK